MKKIFLILFSFAFYSCSADKMAVKTVSNIIDSGMPAVFSERDLKYAKESLPSNLKLMEILLKTKEDEKLLLNASIGFCGYAWAFLEEESSSQAAEFYKKGIFYSSKILEKKKAIKENQIDSKKVNGKTAPALFWNTFCKSALINLNPSDSENSAMLGETEDQANILAQKYPNYFYNSVYAILGSVYASKPKIMGGDINKSAFFFEKSFEKGGDSFLLNKYMYAKTYAVSSQNEDLFIKTLQSILDAPITEQTAFFDAVAKQKSAVLMEKKNEYF
ncbi:MAG: hypothetical protein GX447_08535 [Elusimicrobia bacterium]|nr:hypothetical protein [Elusimicrobiota bacterium]